jgi:hypothetical protein
LIYLEHQNRCGFDGFVLSLNEVLTILKEVHMSSMGGAKGVSHLLAHTPLMAYISSC